MTKLAIICLCLGFVCGEGLAPEEKIIYDAVGTFGQSLLMKLNDKSVNENIIFSPYSVHAALTTASFLAAGRTKVDLYKALHFGEADNRLVVKGFIDTMSRIHAAFKKLTFENVSDVDFAKRLRPRRSHKAAVQLKFQHDSQGPALMHSLYYKGNWKKMFSEIETPALFNQGCAAIEKNVTTWLRQMANINFHDSSILKAQLLLLPYSTRSDFDIEMLIILPNEEHLCKTQNWTKTLSWTAITKELIKTRPESIQLSLPKLNIEALYNLEEILPSMGMESAFDPHLSNFSRIARANASNVGTVIHKSTMTVTKSGTGTESDSIDAAKESARKSATHLLTIDVNRSFYIAIIYRYRNTPDVMPVFSGIVNIV